MANSQHGKPVKGAVGLTPNLPTRPYSGRLQLRHGRTDWGVFCLVPKTSPMTKKRRIYGPFPSVYGLELHAQSEIAHQRMPGSPEAAFAVETPSFEGVGE